jgi:AmmeMemoRadiSam system protein A
MAPRDTTTLGPEERTWLLGLARSTITARLRKEPLPDRQPVPGPLTEIRGAFVTLTIAGALRGCIGHVIGTEPLWLSVRANAINAAFRDPRFPPLSASELPTIEIEISALTPLWPVSSPDEIVIGRDGLVIERGVNRGLLLPQVAERYGWSPVEFLDQTCRKAGMEPGCWRSNQTRIEAFSAEVFGV